MLDKELLVFPLLSLIVLLAILAGFLSPYYVENDPNAIIDAIIGDATNANEWTLGAISFASYLIGYLVIIFFNSALIACVKYRFTGGDPTVMYGIKQSMQRLPQIFLWALVTATVGFVLLLLEGKKEEGQTASSFIVRIIGAAWAIASYFVVPIIVTEKLGPIAGMKRSIAIIKKTWGESMASVVGISVIGGILTLIGFALLMASVMAFEDTPELSAVLFGVGIVWIALSSLITTTLGAILKAALYVYAVEGKIPGSFEQSLVDNAFSARTK